MGKPGRVVRACLVEQLRSTRLHRRRPENSLRKPPALVQLLNLTNESPPRRSATRSPPRSVTAAATLRAKRTAAATSEARGPETPALGADVRRGPATSAAFGLAGDALRRGSSSFSDIEILLPIERITDVGRRGVRDGAPAPVRVSCRRWATSRRLRPTRPTMMTPSTFRSNGNASENVVSGGVSITTRS
jgi:hypothetical protein